MSQENTPDLAQRLLLRAFEPDLEHFPGCYFSKFITSQKPFEIFYICLKGQKSFFISNKILETFTRPKGCTQKKY